MSFIMDDIDASSGDEYGEKITDDHEDPFLLEEEIGANQEKYISDFEVSDNEIDNENSFEQEEKSNKSVPCSLPININFGVDPRTNKPRPPPNREEKRSTPPIEHNNIFESMQEISRSMQPADYRDRVFGTKPSLDDKNDNNNAARSATNYLSMYNRAGIRPQPATIVYHPMPLQPSTIGEETGEESSSQTPK